MNVLHLLAAGGAGGIETLNKDYAKYSKLNNYFMFIWFGGITADQMKQAGNHVLELNASKKDILGPYKRILSICKEKNIDAIVVHHASPMLHLYALWTKKRIKKLHVIIYAHGSAEDMCRTNIKKGLKLRKFIMKYSLSNCDIIISISKYVKESIISFYGIKESKIKVIYNGVDLTRFTGIPHEPGKNIELIYIGRLIKQKGIQNTLYALSSLPLDLNYKFRIVGDGIYRKKLELYVNELNLEKKVEFLGTRQDVPKLLERSDIFIHIPEWEEGFGIAIVEAMAAGTIPVCTYSGAIPEVIQNNIDGILVERNNSKELAAILEFLIKNINDKHVKEIRIKAIKNAKHFSSTHFAENVDDLLLSAYMKI